MKAQLLQKPVTKLSMHMRTLASHGKTVKIDMEEFGAFKDLLEKKKSQRTEELRVIITEHGNPRTLLAEWITELTKSLMWLVSPELEEAKTIVQNAGRVIETARRDIGVLTGIVPRSTMINEYLLETTATYDLRVMEALFLGMRHGPEVHDKKGKMLASLREHTDPTLALQCMARRFPDLGDFSDVRSLVGILPIETIATAYAIETGTEYSDDRNAIREKIATQLNGIYVYLDEYDVIKKLFRAIRFMLGFPNREDKRIEPGNTAQNALYGMRSMFTNTKDGEFARTTMEMLGQAISPIQDNRKRNILKAVFLAYCLENVTEAVKMAEPGMKDRMAGVIDDAHAEKWAKMVYQSLEKSN